MTLWIQCCSKEMTEKEENRDIISFLNSVQELTSSVNYIFHRHESMRTILQHPCKNPGMVVCTCKSSVRIAEAGRFLGFAEKTV